MKMKARTTTGRSTAILPVLLLRFVDVSISPSTDFTTEKIKSLFNFRSFLIQLSFEIGVHDRREFGRGELFKSSAFDDVFVASFRFLQRTTRRRERRWGANETAPMNLICKFQNESVRLFYVSSRWLESSRVADKHLSHLNRYEPIRRRWNDFSDTIGRK